MYGLENIFFLLFFLSKLTFPGTLVWKLYHATYWEIKNHWIFVGVVFSAYNIFRDIRESKKMKFNTRGLLLSSRIKKAGKFYKKKKRNGRICITQRCSSIRPVELIWKISLACVRGHCTISLWWRNSFAEEVKIIVNLMKPREKMMK